MEVESSLNNLCDKENEVYLKFTCKDTGSGVRPESLRKLCTPFFQEGIDGSMGMFIAISSLHRQLSDTTTTSLQLLYIML